MRPAVPGGGSCGHAGCAARADVAPAAPCAGAPPLSAPHRTHRELRRASTRWCRRGTSAPRPSTIIEAGSGEHIKSSSCAAFPPGRDPTQRFVHRVFDRRRAELGTSCAEHVLVEVDQVLCHVSSTYPPAWVISTSSKAAGSPPRCRRARHGGRSVQRSWRGARPIVVPAGWLGPDQAGTGKGGAVGTTAEQHYRTSLTIRETARRRHRWQD